MNGCRLPEDILEKYLCCGWVESSRSYWVSSQLEAARCDFGLVWPQAMSMGLCSFKLFQLPAQAPFFIRFNEHKLVHNHYALHYTKYCTKSGTIGVVGRYLEQGANVKIIIDIIMHHPPADVAENPELSHS